MRKRRPQNLVSRDGWIFALAMIATLLVSPDALAERALALPTGPVLLTISGAIENTNVGKEAKFDRNMLEALGVDTVQTSTTWTKGVKTFRGVLGRKILRAVGVTGKHLKAHAINDYFVAIPISDLEMYDVLFATSMDGVDFTRRDKGPIWVIYPRDAHAELRNAKADSKFIWQLVRIVVE